ncbi:MAG: FIST C-terminal domain-containing protein [Coriobacteriales bacterium]|nr:FIST C-terminal domain-containing protein [Coriobacteriales bacterium]
MIRALSAFTSEIDDVDEAVADILGQLSLKNQLRAHSVGLISGVPEFVESGVIEALQEALPFDLVGQTTIAASSPGSSSLETLSLLVLTSDEIEFVIGQTDPILGENADIIKDGYLKATEGRTEKPATLLIYAPLLYNVGGDFLVENLDEVSEHVPLFGTLAVDNTIDYHKSRVIFRGKASTDRLAFVALYGDLKPRFFLATISHESIFEEKGVVTSSDGNQLKTVDGKSAVDFLKSKGLATDENGIIEGVNSFPYIVDFNDGNPPVIRVIFATTPEGNAVCLGDIPEGSTLSVGHFGEDEMLATTRVQVEAIAADDERHSAIIFSCIGRYFTLVLDPSGEIEEAHGLLDPLDARYTFSYSGGEICPVTSMKDGVSLTNRFHNATFIAMTF